MIRCASRYICISVLLLSATSAHAINLSGNSFFINRSVGDNSRPDTLSLMPILDDGEAYGQVIYFGEDGTFADRYGSSCGNDCFPASSGTYEIVDSVHVRIILKKFDQTGDCKDIHTTPNKDLGVFRLDFRDDGQLYLISLNVQNEKIGKLLFILILSMLLIIFPIYRIRRRMTSRRFHSKSKLTQTP